MDEDDLDKLREKRKAQLIAAQKIKQVCPKTLLTKSNPGICIRCYITSTVYITSTD